jgi:predicted acetyltransferase
VGYAKQALALMLPQAKQRGVSFVELTTCPGNDASQKVILGCGGRLLERFVEPAAYGSVEGLRLRIDLADVRSGG